VGGREHSANACLVLSRDVRRAALDAYAQECDPDQLELPENSNMEGTGVIPGTSRKFNCMSGYVLKGAANVHCNQDGSWEESPVCEAAPATTAAATTAPTTKHWNFWRVLNAGTFPSTPPHLQLLLSLPLLHLVFPFPPLPPSAVCFTPASSHMHR
jgi:hypothetical protein